VRTCDIAIIGGGVIGVSIAFELAADNLRVVVFDRQQPGREASWAAAGMLSPAPDSSRDLPLVPFARRSLGLYPQFIASIEDASGKRTGYARDGALEIFFSRDTDAESKRAARLRELQQFGIAAEEISLDDARRMAGALGPAAGSALWLPDEGTVEPRLLMDALLTAARNRGVEVRAGCEVTELIQSGERCSGVLAAGEKVPAEHVVLAAGCFSSRLGGNPAVQAFAPTRPVRGQMLALRPNAGTVALPRVMRSESSYLVPRRDGRIVAGSTNEEAGFEKQVTAAGIGKILGATLEMCPELGRAEVIETWAGLRPGTPDDLPILGPADTRGLWVATGHYRNGILLAPATARVFQEFISGVESSFNVAPFSPMRFAQREMRAAQTAV
jgi:glycine oxidase